MRRASWALLVVAAGLLPGCAVSLFSRDDGPGDSRVEAMEKRMDAIEQRFPK